MKYKNLWTSNACSDFSNVVRYIKYNWGKDSAEEFINQIDNIISIISIFPRIGRSINSEKQIRAFVIFKQIILIYRIKMKSIIILNLFDTRQSPDKFIISEPLAEYK